MAMSHPWLDIAWAATCVDELEGYANVRVHESCLRSYQILAEVKGMLARGDSPETIRKFIDFCESRGEQHTGSGG